MSLADVPDSANLREYNLHEELGHGSFGIVYKAYNQTTSQVAAVKIVPADKDFAALISEIDILKSCDSKFITRYYGSGVADGNIWIVLEFCGGGSVSELISASPKKALDLGLIVTITASVTSALNYLHANKLLHRDVKCSNVLLTESGAVKVADFGVCTKLSDAVSKRNTIIGTPFWMAPEVIREESYDFKADIWSLGICVIEMADGAPPFSHMHPMRAIFLIPMMTSPPKLRDEDKYPSTMLDFIAQCLTMQASERPSSASLAGHAFVKNEIEKLNRSGGLSSELADAIQEAKVKLEAIREKKAKSSNKPTTENADSTGSFHSQQIYYDEYDDDDFGLNINESNDTNSDSSSNYFEGMADFQALGTYVPIGFRLTSK